MGRDELLELGSRIVEKAGKEGFEEAATIIVKNRETMVKLANSQPSVIQSWDEYRVSLYLARNKRIFVIELRPKDLSVFDKPLKELLKYAERIEESMFYAPLPEPEKVEVLEGLVDKNLFDHLENPLRITEVAVEAAHRENIDYVAGTIDLWYYEKALVTSKGAELYEDRTGYQMYLRAFSGEDGSGQWSTCGTRVDLEAVEKASTTAARYAVDSRGRSAVEPGKYDLVLSPLVFGNLVNLIARMSSAFSIVMGMSIFMRNKPGDKVASDKLTIRDAPRLVELPYATSFDDEGVSTYDKPIIENGMLKNILHNTKTASKLGGKSTGNAGWIYPRPWNLVVEPGDMDLEEMIGEVRRGILITNNWYTRLQNYVEGIFSTITRDALFLIEDGRVVKPVEKIRIADKLPKLLNNVVGVGRDTYNIMWWEVTIPTKLPYVLVKDINVSKHML